MQIPQFEETEQALEPKPDMALEWWNYQAMNFSFFWPMQHVGS